jgi:hypothetical protein
MPDETLIPVVMLEMAEEEWAVFADPDELWNYLHCARGKEFRCGADWLPEEEFNEMDTLELAAPVRATVQ